MAWDEAEKERRAVIQERMLQDYHSLYPNADSFSFSLFAEKIGLEMITSYEPDHDRKPHRMRFVAVKYTRGSPNLEDAYAVEWSRPDGNV